MQTVTRTKKRPVERVKTIVSTLVVIAIFAASIWSIYHLLQEIDLHKVVHLVRSTPATTILIAVICMLGAYASMVGYDWSALRYLGKSLPFRWVITGGFVGYAMAANVGGGPLTGGAIRYRIYTPLGLSIPQAASVALFGSIAFALGMTVIGTGSLMLYPTALDGLTSLSPTVVRVLAGAVYVTCLAIVGTLAFRKSAITVFKTTIRAPSLGLVGGQILLTAADFLLAATTLYLLLPANDVGIFAFLAIYTAAVVVSVTSHVPGGMGVFEAVIFAALPDTVSLEATAAALLLFRVIFYFVPFGMALTLLAITELTRARRLGRLRERDML